MNGTYEPLCSKKSRIMIFDEPIICNFCAHDVFIPYRLYVNVEDPGILVFHVRTIAICHHCGQAKLFHDPRFYVPEKHAYIWGLKQDLIALKNKNYNIRILLYVGQRNDDKITAFIHKLSERFHIEVENMGAVKGGAILQLNMSSYDDVQQIKYTIMRNAKLLHVTIKELTIK